MNEQEEWDELKRLMNERRDFLTNTAEIVNAYGGIVDKKILEAELNGAGQDRTQEEKDRIYREGKAFRLELYAKEKAENARSLAEYEEAIKALEASAAKEKSNASIANDERENVVVENEAVKVENEKLSKSLKIGGGVAVVLIFGLLIYFYMKK